HDRENGSRVRLIKIQECRLSFGPLRVVRADNNPTNCGDLSNVLFRFFRMKSPGLVSGGGPGEAKPGRKQSREEPPTLRCHICAKPSHLRSGSHFVVTWTVSMKNDVAFALSSDATRRTWPRLPRNADRSKWTRL